MNFYGLGVALVTPFKKDLSIDYDSLARIINHLIDGSADYIVALGTTAETPTLTSEEKQHLTTFIREITADRIPLIIGIGGNNTSAVIEEIRCRNLEGYSAILSVVPYYNKPTQEGLFYHFKAISEASPIPIVLYNVPGRTGANLTSATTLRLANNSNKIIGIKEASGKKDQIKEIIKESPEGFSVISGNDNDTAFLMKSGAKGVISVLGNALPKNVKYLINLCEEKKYEESEAYQNKLNPLIRHLFEDGNPAGVKFILSKMGLCENILRLPLTPVSKEVGEKIEKAVSLLT